MNGNISISYKKRMGRNKKIKKIKIRMIINLFSYQDEDVKKI